MKTYRILFLALVNLTVFLGLSAQTSTENYVRVRTYLSSPLFSQQLYYNVPEDGSAQNRLSSATYTQNGTECGYYDISPYVYCLNNPLKNIDPDGRGVWSRGAKLLRHVGKSVAKNGLKALNTAETYTSAFSDIKESVNTLMDANASTADKIMAGISLASEFAPVSVEDAKEVGKVAKGLTKDFSKIGSTGKVGEDALKELGGVSQHPFKTSQGKRIVDQFSEGVAHESKVGYQSLTKGIKSQIQKDSELMETKAIDGVTWHFFESPVTGKGGPNKPLMDELKKNGITSVS